MRRFLLLLVTCFLFATANAQVKKLYGYRQEVSGGAMQVNNEKELTVNARYFLFVEIKKGMAVRFDKVWINGHPYSFKTDTVKKIPFILQTSNGGEMIFRDTLIRSSKGTIIQLKDLARTGTGRNMSTKNKLLVYYRYKNRLQSISLQKLKELRPLFTQ